MMHTQSGQMWYQPLLFSFPKITGNGAFQLHTWTGPAVGSAFDLDLCVQQSDAWASCTINLLCCQIHVFWRKVALSWFPTLSSRRDFA